MAVSSFEFVYIPAQSEPNNLTKISLNHALENYIQTEFPNLFGQTPSSYIVPSTFLQQNTPSLSVVPSSLISEVDQQRLQGDTAEELIFNALKYMKIPGIVFHGRPYINKSKGGNTFKEHDFVILTTENKICLIEVKSCADTKGPLVKVLSDGKSIRDNRRSGMHQLEAHLSILLDKFGITKSSIGQILTWPFLAGQDSRGRDRFLQDSTSGIKHIFRDISQDKDAFSNILSDLLNQLPPLEKGTWKSVLQWFTLLACGAVIDTLIGKMDSQLILLSQDQLSVVEGDANNNEDPVIIYGPPGSGKTILILEKIKQLWEDNLIGPDMNCLLLTGRYGTGITAFVDKCLEKQGIKNVTVKSLPSSHETFQAWCTKETNSFTHVFFDGVEDLAWYGKILKNIEFIKCTRKSSKNGYFWCMMDGSQLVYNLAIHGGPQATSQIIPQLSLSKSFRSTANIFSFTKSFVVNTEPDRQEQPVDMVDELNKCLSVQHLSLAHGIKGPPVYFVNYDHFVSREETVCMLIIDLCGYKGIRPNDIVLMTSSSILYGRLNITAINQGLQTYFNGKGFIPKGIVGVSRFLNSSQEEQFCVSSVSGYKGLEAKVVIVLPILFKNSSKDMIKKMLYSMCSRCLSLLIIVWNDTDSVSVIDTKTLSPYSLTSSQCPLQQFFQKVYDENKEETERLKREAERLKTFETYPPSANVSPSDLAKNGFIFRGVESDSVMCVFCGGVIYDWEPNDVPSKEHTKFYSNCPFILGEDVGNVPLL